MRIYKDLKNGGPTQKGVKEIVKGLWANMIYEESQRGRR